LGLVAANSLRSNSRSSTKPAKMGGNGRALS
jgi:hypothetical protein